MKLLVDTGITPSHTYDHDRDLDLDITCTMVRCVSLDIDTVVEIEFGRVLDSGVAVVLTIVLDVDILASLAFANCSCVYSSSCLCDRVCG